MFHHLLYTADQQAVKRKMARKSKEKPTTEACYSEGESHRARLWGRAKRKGRSQDTDIEASAVSAPLRSRDQESSVTGSHYSTDLGIGQSHLGAFCVEAASAGNAIQEASRPTLLMVMRDVPQNAPSFEPVIVEPCNGTRDSAYSDAANTPSYYVVNYSEVGKLYNQLHCASDYVHHQKVEFSGAYGIVNTTSYNISTLSARIGFVDNDKASLNIVNRYSDVYSEDESETSTPRKRKNMVSVPRYIRQLKRRTCPAPVLSPLDDIDVKVSLQSDDANESCHVLTDERVSLLFPESYIAPTGARGESLAKCSPAADASPSGASAQISRSLPPNIIPNSVRITGTSDSGVVTVTCTVDPSDFFTIGNCECYTIDGSISGCSVTVDGP